MHDENAYVLGVYEKIRRTTGESPVLSAGENAQAVSERATVRWVAYMKSSFPDVYPLGMMTCRRHGLAQDTPLQLPGEDDHATHSGGGTVWSRRRTSEPWRLRCAGPPRRFG